MASHGHEFYTIIPSHPQTNLDYKSTITYANISGLYTKSNNK